MQNNITVWKGRLRASVSAVVLSCVLPCMAVANVPQAENETESAMQPVVLKAPVSAALPWLVSGAVKPSGEVAGASNPAGQEKKASVLQAPHNATQSASGKDHAHAEASVKSKVHRKNGAEIVAADRKQSITLRPPQCVAAERTLPDIDRLSLWHEEKDEALPWLVTAAGQSSQKGKERVVLNPPVSGELPWQVTQKKTTDVPVEEPSVSPFSLVDKEEEDLDATKITEVASKNSAVPLLLHPPVQVVPQEGQAGEKVIAANAHSDIQIEKEGKVVVPSTQIWLTRMDTAAQQVEEGYKMAAPESLSPAAGGSPLTLMAPKEQAAKLDLPLTLTPPAPGRGPSAASGDNTPVQAPQRQAVPVAAVEEPKPATKAEGTLSAESRAILEGLPPEPKNGGKKKGSIQVKRDHGGSDNDVKKHESYGLKLAVKRPKLDVFRTLESAYNSLIAGDQQYAITLYKEVLDEDPENTMALFGLATTYHRAGQHQMARPLYAQLLEIDPQNVEGLNNFLVLLAEESPKEALEELNKLQHTHPSFSPLPAQMALIYQKNGEYAKAAEKMVQALSLAPENLKYQYNMAVICDRMGNWDEAARWYQRLLSAQDLGEKIPGDAEEIQQRLTFIRSNASSAH